MQSSSNDDLISVGQQAFDLKHRLPSIGNSTWGGSPRMRNSLDGKLVLWTTGQSLAVYDTTKSSVITNLPTFWTRYNRLETNKSEELVPLAASIDSNQSTVLGLANDSNSQLILMHSKGRHTAVDCRNLNLPLGIPWLPSEVILS